MSQPNSASRLTTPDSGLPTVLRRVLSPTGNTGDAIFRILLLGAALLMLVIVVTMIFALAVESMPSIRQFGFGFITGTEWNPVKSE